MPSGFPTVTGALVLEGNRGSQHCVVLCPVLGRIFLWTRSW